MTHKPAPTVSIISQCNNNCPYCFQRKSYHNEEKQVSFENLKKLSDWIKQEYDEIIIMGGEALLHPDIIRIMRYLSENYRHVKLITNFLAENIETLVQIAELDNVSWNINTTIDKNNKPLFDKNIDLMFHKYGLNDNSKRIVGFSLTFTGHTTQDFQYIDNLFNILQKIPLESRNIRVTPQMPCNYDSTSKYEFVNYDKQFLYFMDKVKQGTKISACNIDCGTNLCLISGNVIRKLIKELNIKAQGPGCIAPFVDINADLKLMYCNYVSEKYFPKKFYYEFEKPSDYIKEYLIIKNELLSKYKFLCRQTLDPDCNKECTGICPAVIENILENKFV